MIISSPSIVKFENASNPYFRSQGYEIADIDLNYAEDEGLAAAIARICEEAAQGFVMAKPYWCCPIKIRQGFIYLPMH